MKQKSDIQHQNRPTQRPVLYTVMGYSLTNVKHHIVQIFISYRSVNYVYG